MAVMRNSIIFGGVDSADFGIYIGGEGTFNAPKRDVEMISIPGRNGAFALDKGRFENIEVTYSAFNFEPDLDTFSAQLEAFRNAICSQKGYQRLTDTFHPDEYRMAAYIDGLEIKPVNFNTASTFDIVFDCKPQRYLLSGEEPITIGEWHETETASGEIASFEAKAGDAVKSLVADIEPIQSLNGYDKPWSGGAGKNKLPYPYTQTTRTENGVTFTDNGDGTVKVNGTATANTVFYLAPSAEGALGFLPTGSYIVNGCPSGGGTSTYEIQMRINGTWFDVGSAETQINYVNGGGGADTCRIRVLSGQTVNNLVFKPMIRLASETDATYEPYSNICPISGYDSVVVSRYGRNLLNVDDAEIGTSWSGASNSARARLVIPCEPNTAYTLSMNGTMSVDAVYYVSSKAIPPTAIAGPVTFPVRFTTSASHKYITLGFSKTAITKADIEALKLQLEFGSTATAYEPYQGNTYTTDLNDTRYGGTLDVASGVLTVTHAKFKLSDCANGSYVSGSKVFGFQFNSLGINTSRSASGVEGCISDMFSNYYTGSSISLGSIPNGSFCVNLTSMSSGNSTITLKDTNYTTVQDVLSAYGDAEFVVPYSTPQTVQLTAQEVKLLVGLNQVWANSGDVEVEYGTAPNVLVNPTLFESSPMLEVEGYGSININDDTVTIQNEELGTIKISGSGGSGSSMPLNTAQLNNGDTIFYNSAPYVDVKVKANSGKLRITRNGAPTNGSCSISKETANITYVQVRPSETTFSKGTNKTVTTTVPLYVSVNDTVTSCTLTLTTSYSASTEKVTLSASWTSAPNTINTTNEYRHNQYYGDSTKSILPSPMYIDLDIGEAYGVIDNEPLSFDNIVTLPAELPKLKSGANEVTFDNTVTDLKVVPRYWKI